jgi:cell division initiation protein
MLTPIEIQSKVLKSGMGYSKKETDLFFQDVSYAYEELYKENVELKEKLTTLSDGLQYYKNIEKTIQKALILAEKTAAETKESAQLKANTIEESAQLKADAIQESAQLKANTIEENARAKANVIVSDAKSQLDQLHNQTINLMQQYDKYMAQYKQLALTQLELLNSESSQIHIANLDSFTSTLYHEEIKSEDKALKEYAPTQEGEDEIKGDKDFQEIHEILEPKPESSSEKNEEIEEVEETEVTEETQEDEDVHDIRDARYINYLQSLQNNDKRSFEPPIDKTEIEIQNAKNGTDDNDDIEDAFEFLSDEDY